MNRLIAIATFVLLTGTGALAADQTWTGQISDSSCGVKHEREERGKKMTDRDCTALCVKFGANYLFVSGGKVYNLVDQNDPALVTHAGHTVMLTGAMNGDRIKVTKIEMPAKSGKAAS